MCIAAWSQMLARRRMLVCGRGGSFYEVRGKVLSKRARSDVVSALSVRGHGLRMKAGHTKVRAANARIRPRLKGTSEIHLFVVVHDQFHKQWERLSYQRPSGWRLASTQVRERPAHPW